LDPRLRRLRERNQATCDGRLVGAALAETAAREGPKAIVQAWDRDKPEQAGELRIEVFELKAGTDN
jgi:hypothetical protein